jgi:DNA-directed RNA polymerase subunit RPC12/RpoP
MAQETERAYRCVDCGNMYRAHDGVQVYRLDGEIVCELCREDREERAS